MLQVNAFCNTDDITWGTKNLDTKKDATQTKSLLKSSMRYASGGWHIRAQLAVAFLPKAPCLSGFTLTWKFR